MRKTFIDTTLTLDDINTYREFLRDQEFKYGKKQDDLLSLEKQQDDTSCYDLIAKD